MICEAILKIKSDAQVSVSGVDIDDCVIEWHDGNPTNITKEQIKSKIEETQYARKRKSEYPSIEELVVALYDTDDKTAIDAKRAEIKLKYPKPGA